MEVCWNSHTKVVFDNKIGMSRIIGLGIRTVRSCLGTSSTCSKKQNLKKSKISIFGEFSKFLRFNWFWADFENKQAYMAVWAVLGRFQIVFSNFDYEYLLKYEEFWSMKWLFGKVWENSTSLIKFNFILSIFSNWEADQSQNVPFWASLSFRG